MKHSLFILMFLQLCFSARAEISEAKLAKSRDYLANWISIEVLKELSKTKPELESRYRAMLDAVPDLAIGKALNETEFGPAALKEVPKLYRELTVHIFQINTHDLKDLEMKKAAEALVDSALGKVNLGYSSEFIILSESRGRLVDDIVEYLEDEQQTQPEEPQPGNSSTRKPNTGKLIYGSYPGYINILIGVLFLLTAFLYYTLFFNKNKREKAQDGSTVKPHPDTADIKKIVLDELAKQFPDGNIKPAPEEGNQLGSNQGVPDAFLQATAATGFTKKEKQVEDNVFYMTFPVNNYFALNGKSNTGENACYRFKVLPGNREASFEWHNSGASSIQQALSAVARFIEPACIQDNNPLPNTRSIRTLKPGKAVLEGDKWVIKEKAIIQYE